MPFLPLGNLPNPGIEPASLMSSALAGRFFTIVPHGKHLDYSDAKTIIRLLKLDPAFAYAEPPSS